MLRRQPYTHAKPSTGRYLSGIIKAKRKEDQLIPPTEPVDRDPCPRCGVRRDIGCGHSLAPLGTVL